MVRRIVRADVAPDRATVPHLDVGDLRADLAEDRPSPRFRRPDDVRVRRHRTDLDRAVRTEVDSLQLLEVVEVDEDVGRGRSGLHDVDQRLASRERAGPIVLRKETHGIPDARRASVLDLPQEHALFRPESPARVKKQR